MSALVTTLGTIARAHTVQPREATECVIYEGIASRTDSPRLHGLEENLVDLERIVVLALVASFVLVVGFFAARSRRQDR